MILLGMRSRYLYTRWVVKIETCDMSSCADTLTTMATG
jgi:hypothetical protein